MARCLLAALVAALVLAAPARGQRVRVFAVGPKFDLSWVETRETYRAKLFALMDRAQRPPGLVQRGAGDVASRRVASGRTLVVLPEDLGLMAALGGSRGGLARMVTPDTGGL